MPDTVSLQSLPRSTYQKLSQPFGIATLFPQMKKKQKTKKAAKIRCVVTISTRTHVRTSRNPEKIDSLN